MTGASRLVRMGLLDAERRLGRLTAPHDASTDRRLLPIVRASVVVTALRRVLDCLAEAASASAAAAALREGFARWRRIAPSARRALAGTSLLVAVGVHLSLRIWRGADPGWMWLIVPGTAAAIGTLLVATARESGRVLDS